MSQDDRDILEVLKAELNFVQKGGYGRSPRESWSARLFFEDSPSCMNYDSKENKAPCAQCALAQFVPTDLLAEKVPCRHIPLTEAGESLYELYRGGTQQQIEEAMAAWLKREITKLEAEQAASKAK
jgi:hypothetical protein